MKAPGPAAALAAAVSAAEEAGSGEFLLPLSVGRGLLRHLAALELAVGGPAGRNLSVGNLPQTIDTTV